MEGKNIHTAKGSTVVKLGLCWMFHTSAQDAKGIKKDAQNNINIKNRRSCANQQEEVRLRFQFTFTVRQWIYIT